MIKNFLLKKDKGSGVMSLLPLIICMMTVGLMIIIFASWMSNFDKKTQLNAVLREYSLKMETTGYLTTAQQTLLTEELEDIGCKNISFIGSTLSQAKYGDEIFLEVSCKVTILDYDFSDKGYKLFKNTKDIDFHKIKTSTAKH